MLSSVQITRDLDNRAFLTQVDGKKAVIDIGKMEVSCPEDEVFRKIVHTACTKLKHSLVPPPVPKVKAVANT